MKVEDKYCPCGYPVEIFTWPNQVYPIIRDSHSQAVITFCPNCGNQLENNLVDLGEMNFFRGLIFAIGVSLLFWAIIPWAAGRMF